MYSIRKWFIICIRTMKGHLSASSNEKCSCSMACTPPCIQNLHDLTFELWTFSTAWNCIHVDKTGEEWWSKTYWDALKCHLVNGCESQWLNLSVQSGESIPDFTGFMKSLYEILKGKSPFRPSTLCWQKLASASCFHHSGCISNTFPGQFPNARFIWTHH